MIRNNYENNYEEWYAPINGNNKHKACLYIAKDLPDHITWRFDFKTMNVLEVSPAVKNILGYDQAEIIQMPIEQLITSDSYNQIMEKMPIWLNALGTGFSQGIHLVGDIEQLCKDGRTIWVELTVYLFRRNDNFLEAIGVSREIRAKESLAIVCRKLAEREKFLQAAWDTTPCFLTCVDVNGNYLLANKRFTDFWGINHSEIVGKNYLDVLAAELKEKHRKIFQECLKGQTVEFLDKCRPVNVDKDCWSYGIYSPVFSNTGAVEKVLVAIMDITDQYEMKQQLVEAEKAGHTGSWKFNLITKKFTCSEGTLELYGIQRKDIEKDSYNALYLRADAVDVARLKMRFRNIVADGKQFNEEVKIQLSKMEKRLVKVNCSIIADAAGHPKELLGRVEDITKQRVLEDLEKDMMYRIKDFLKAMPGAGMLLDINGKVIEVFDDNHLLTRNAIENWHGHSLYDLLPAVTAKGLVDKTVAAVENNMMQFYECEIEVETGRRIFNVRVSPLNYRSDEIPTVACYMTDITEQRKAKRLLDPEYIKKRQQNLLNEIIEGKLKPSKELLDQTWHAKLNLTHDFSCYLIVFESSKKTGICCANKKNAKEKKINKFLQRIAEEPGVIAWESKDGLAILDPVVYGTNDQSAEMKQADYWCELVEEYMPSIEYNIGIAEFHASTFWCLAKVYEQALTAVNLGAKIYPNKLVYHYLDIGVFQFFPAMLNRGYMDDFVRRTLGRLEEYDQQHGTDLVKTLGQILKTDNINEVAKKLFVHRQTVLFRKKRIENILNISLDDFETRLALIMALKFKMAFKEGN